ncbi:Putative NADPH-quinone reductase (modulator of drug activity B) [Dyadobacter soli]|uniref:Putative NADPH-quinone reductase (Modulator of drug activity B) n=1 Tax=Dyadobacter soli TaxID=659014 RepID=A0A1G6VRN8_9BACT|nr:NAD(P)H-dependent oxidoreductase [Dyadobacter soli]SDD56073.1 Putative NADPH-quinone reductase (modulator of drug activity B) [Dyadobacter soli]
MKTLVIVIHPDINSSIVNKQWLEALNRFPEKFTIHSLHEAYPDEKLDVPAEQRLIEQHDRIIFQFPFYWFNCPPLLKKWLDEVMTYGWAYGSRSGYKMAGKKVALAISLGIDQHEYNHSARYKYTVEELTRPFELSFEYVKADYRPFFGYYGIELDSSKEWIDSSVDEYLHFLDTFAKSV